jgi:mannose-6-phosphate isomerase-like protein (cupin superfamily)
MPAHVDIDNSRVRVTRWTLGQGEETGQHLHEHDYIVIPLVSGRMLITHADGSQARSELTRGVPYFREAGVRHNVANLEPQPLDFVEVELRDQAGGREPSARETRETSPVGGDADEA